MNERPSESSPSQIQAIFLVTRTRAGPRILVHYPPAPGQGQDVASNVSSRRASTDAQASDLISQDAGVANNKPTVTVQNSSPPDYHDAYRSIIGLEPETIPWRPSTAYSPSSPTIAGLSIPIRPVTASIASDPHAAASILQTTQLPSPRVQQTWTRVLGFPAEGLARMLAPGNRSWHKHKLELQMRDMYFVGCPIFERVEGGWSKNKKRTKDANDMLANDGEEEAMNIESEQPSLDGISRSSTNDTMSGESQDSAERSSTTAGTAIPSKENQSTVSTAAATSFATASSSLPSSNGGGAIDGLATSGPDTLHMFNVVIVLSDPSSPHPRGQSPTSSASVDVYANSEKSVQQIRHQQRVKEIYAHCVKKLARALHIQQKKDGYVWNEVKKIIGVREKAREAGASYSETWATLYNASSLARALSTTYTSINTSSIAHLHLGLSTSVSLQLPLQTSTTRVPTPTAPALPPSPTTWLTTFTPNLDSDNNPTHLISPSSALILLYPRDTLLKSLASSPPSPLTAPLTYYLRHTTPTKSLAQLSRKSRLSLQTLQLLSSHLIHFRRARATPPLHHTNTYIVSPLAPWADVEASTTAFRLRFAALPSLPVILARLSSTTSLGGKGSQIWGRMMPSPDHKDAYMEVLEWLVRSGWVTQLRTFAWVLIPSSTKRAVALKMLHEERDAAAVAAKEAIAEREEAVEVDDEHGILGPPALSEMSREKRKSSQGSSSLLSPRLKPWLSVSGRRGSEAGSVRSVDTALRVPLRSHSRVESPATAPRGKAGNGNGHGHRLSNDSTTPSTTLNLNLRSPLALPSDTSQSPFLNLHAHNSPFPNPTNPSSPSLPSTSIPDTTNQPPTLLPSPHRANALESRWLDHIGSLQDPEVRELWPRLIGYFDGQSALEEIAVMEGIKRKVVNPALGKLVERGVLRVARHW